MYYKAQPSVNLNASKQGPIPYSHTCGSCSLLSLDNLGCLYNTIRGLRSIHSPWSSLWCCSVRGRLSTCCQCIADLWWTIRRLLRWGVVRVTLLVRVLYYTSSINGCRYSLGWLGRCYASCVLDSDWGSSPSRGYSRVSWLTAARADYPAASARDEQADKK